LTNMTWRHAIVILGTSLASQTASATAIVLLVAKDGVVLTADSKQLVLGKESEKPTQKIFRVGRTFLASAGPTHITDDSVTIGGKPWTYDFGVFAREIARRNKTVDTAAVADAVWKEAQRIFRPVGGALAALHQKLLFVIVGVDGGVPHAWEVKVLPTPD